MLTNNRILAFFYAFALIVSSGCSDKHDTARKNPQLEHVRVDVKAAVLKTNLATEQIMGTVQAKTRATLQAKVAGRITELPIKIGQFVKKGDVLGKLDVREIEAKLEQAKAVLAHAKKDYQRYSALFAQGAVTKAEYDAMEARFQAAEATVQEVESMLDYAYIKAPFDGVIVSKYLDIGDFAAPGVPILQIDDLSNLRFEANIPETSARNTQLGTQLTIEIPALGRSLEGTITEVAPAADPNTRTILVKLDLPSTPGLRPGMFGRLFIPTGYTTSVWVPSTAILERGQMTIAYIAKGGRAELRLIKTGKRSKTEVEVLSGIEPGELVIVNNVSVLIDGQPIRID